MKTNSVLAKISILIMAAMIGTFVVTNDASAKWVRQNASVCIYDTVNSGFGYPKFINGAWSNSDNDDNMKFVCPVPNTDYMPQTTIVGVNIHVYDGHDSDNVWAKACRQDFDGSSGWCGSSDSTSNSDVYWDMLQPSVSVLDDKNSDFGYIYIDVADEDDGVSRITGFFYYD
jgi:hypothetical protein